MSTSSRTAARTLAVRAASSFILTLLLVEFLDELLCGAHEAAWPLMRDDLRLSYAEVGVLIGIFMFPGVFLALPGGLISRRVGDKATLVAALGLLVAALALLAAVTGFCTGCEAYKLGCRLTGRPFVSCPLPPQPQRTGR